MEGDGTELCLKWNTFKDTILSYFGHLKNEEEFVDVTIYCEGKALRAHKVVLAASSPYLQTLLEENSSKCPSFILDDVPFHHLEALLSFIYTGKVRIAEDELSAFLDSANLLQIRGLSEVAISQNPQPTEQFFSLVETEILDSPASDVTSPNPQLPVVHSSPSSETHFPSFQYPVAVTMLKTESSLEVNKEKLSDATTSLQKTTRGSRISSEPYSHHKSDFATAKWSAVGKRIATPDFCDAPSTSKRPVHNPPRRLSGPAQMKTEEVYQTYTSAPLKNITESPVPDSSNSVFQQPQWETDHSLGDARRRHSLDPRPCPVCNRVYSNLSNLRQHLRLIHSPKFVTCHLCGKTFKTDLYLRRHIISYHELSSWNPDTGVQAAAPVPLSVVQVNSSEDSSSVQYNSLFNNANSTKDQLTT